MNGRKRSESATLDRKVLVLKGKEVSSCAVFSIFRYQIGRLLLPLILDCSFELFPLLGWLFENKDGHSCWAALSRLYIWSSHPPLASCMDPPNLHWPMATLLQPRQEDAEWNAWSLFSKAAIQISEIRTAKASTKPQSVAS